MLTEPDWKPDPRTVQACLDALQAKPGWSVTNLLATRTLTEMLPDPAKALVEEWLRTYLPDAASFEGYYEHEVFAQWLLDNDRIKP